MSGHPESTSFSPSSDQAPSRTGRDRFGRLLVVDDDPVVGDSLATFLSAQGYAAAFATSGREALHMLDHARQASADRPAEPFAVLIVDMSMPDMNGLDVIRAAREKQSDLVPLVITGYGTIETAVKAIRYGAIDYLTKPVVDEELRVAVEKAMQQHLLIAENTALRQQLDERFGLDNIVGTDSRMQRVYDTILAVAPTKTTVLMAGESGTGKSLVARAIHRRSPRADKPFVEISCGSIPDTLLESELFGHVKGAFTGAHADKEGKFLAADGGTLFLDEINSASPGMQLKLLRVLQERTFEPVGSNRSVSVDVRVILASNQPLEDLVAAGEFRQDLYYRINVVMIRIPPLRERVADIPVLVEHFLPRKAKEAGKQILGLTDDALAALRGYDYPGNVRELENIIERAVVLTRSTRIGVDDLPAHIVDPAGAHRPLKPERDDADADDTIRLSLDHPGPLREALMEPERRIILAALRSNDWNRQQTAEQLDINRTTLYKKMKQYSLDHPSDAA